MQSERHLNESKHATSEVSAKHSSEPD